MKAITTVIFAILISSCVREDEKTTCYSYINGTDKNIQLEFYSFNNPNDDLIGSFEKNGEGLIVEKCATDMGSSAPFEVFKYDSVIVKFNDMRRLSYSISNSADRNFFFNSFFEQRGSSSNYFYEFTEEDFNNAVPY